tara:strand:+ start:2511 stop:4007 length:1497 start_codon:yes stop_codon:yes gene_type:complete
MKSLLDVEKNRISYHKYYNKKTVQRSSLTVPNFSFCNVSISFLNHFLIKRGYKNVACKISAIDNKGLLIDSITIQITKPIVYNLELNEFFLEHKGKINYFIIEFFSEQNLFIPFPAVMINHYNTNFCNVVHSYNRILNDIFEDDKNSIVVPESSFEKKIDNSHDTFFNFSTGIFDFKNKINICYQNSKKKISKNIDVNLSRLNNKSFYISKIFNKKKLNEEGFLKISQPKQSLFYSRMLAGIINKKKKSFSANHTFYDSSEHKEYFLSKKSSKTYPFFSGFLNKIIMYPIMSEGEFNLIIKIYRNKNSIFTKKYIFNSKQKKTLDININKIVDEFNLKEIDAFTVEAISKKKIPTRVNHQLIYGSLNKKISLKSSINVSLNNKEIFRPKNKKGFRWGQIICGKKYESRIGITSSIVRDEDLKDQKLKIKIYNETGKIKSFTKSIKPFSAIKLNLNKLVKIKKETEIIWYSIESDMPNLSAYSFHMNKNTKFSSGEHSF